MSGELPDDIELDDSVAAPPPTSSAGGAAAAEAHLKHGSWNARTRERAAELAALGVDSSPKPVASTDLSPKPASGPSGSAWNAAGTWEERSVTASATADLKARIIAAVLSRSGSRSVAFTGVSSCTGTVSRVWSRGKRRLAFELSLTASWEVREGGEEGALASGTASITDASDMEADVFESLDVQVSACTGCARGEALALVKLCDDPLRRLIKEWADAIRDAA